MFSRDYKQLSGTDSGTILLKEMRVQFNLNRRRYQAYALIISLLDKFLSSAQTDRRAALGKLIQELVNFKRLYPDFYAKRKTHAQVECSLQAVFLKDDDSKNHEMTNEYFEKHSTFFKVRLEKAKDNKATIDALSTTELSQLDMLGGTASRSRTRARTAALQRARDDEQMRLSSDDDASVASNEAQPIHPVRGS